MAPAGTLAPVAVREATAIGPDLLPGPGMPLTGIDTGVSSAASEDVLVKR